MVSEMHHGQHCRWLHLFGLILFSSLLIGSHLQYIIGTFCALERKSLGVYGAIWYSRDKNKYMLPPHFIYGRSNKHQYNGTMPMCSDWWRHVWLPFICSSQTPLQMVVVTLRRSIVLMTCTAPVFIRCSVKCYRSAFHRCLHVPQQ